VFSDYSVLSSSAELLHRLVSPLNAVRAGKRLAHSAVALRDQPIDLAKEDLPFMFLRMLRPRLWAAGVRAAVAERDAAQGWAAVLERRSLIFVSAENSGNEANILDRREPLALLAAHNIMQRFRVDPERIYVGGFSGGSRSRCVSRWGFRRSFEARS